MNGYKAFYNGRELDVRATSLWGAKQQAIELFRAPKTKQHMVSVVLCEKDGVTISHSTAEF